MSWTAVGFCTPEFEQYAEPWSDMIRGLGGTPVVARRSSHGDWAKNTGQKPAAILDVWNEVTDPWFIYIDIDVRLLSAPCVSALPWDVGLMDNLVTTHKNRISAATVFFRKTEGGKRFLIQWRDQCARTGGKDHPVLTSVISQFRKVGSCRMPDASAWAAWLPNGLTASAAVSADTLPPTASSGTVWFAIPSILEPAAAMAALSKWQARGYKVAVQRDPGSVCLPVDLCLTRPYVGYAEAVNHLVARILEDDPSATWIVTGGDDMFPDPTHTPASIADRCSQHFGSTLGVMQPTGDRHLVDQAGSSAAERVCISPWMGREWCQRAYQGHGPLCAEYFHFYVDAELQEVAQAAGLLWNCREITQYHDWRGRSGGPASPHYATLRDKDWGAATPLFQRRKAAGYPGSALLRSSMKLISLTICRNAAWCIRPVIEHALQYCDHAIVLSHACEDTTDDIVRSFGERATLITADGQSWDEMAHRQMTLEKGRELGGTHFLILDDDEIMAQDMVPLLRHRAEKLAPGELLRQPLRCCWRDIDNFRSDPGSPFARCVKSTVFRDSPDLHWHAADSDYQYHHTHPYNSKATLWEEGGGWLHLQHADWRRLVTKQTWYMCMELCRYGSIKADYRRSMSENGLKLSPVPEHWRSPHMRELQLDALPWQVGDLRRMLKEKGAGFFTAQGVDIQTVLKGWDNV